jgi:hypothetical protein
MGIDGHQLARLRVASPLATFPGPDLECAESPKLDDPVFLQTAFHLFEEFVVTLWTSGLFKPSFDWMFSMISALVNYCLPWAYSL